MARLRQDATTLARTSPPVLLLGETGTGKSALAERVLHAASGRDGPFIAVDLSALPENLVAAELFGTARGAYSGAVEREGRFERADGGTLLLDEVGNLAQENQRMLLLALQDGRVTRLGENHRTRSVDVKVVATNADLEAQVRAGTFRADLYARLNPAARLKLPPLRERSEDLDSLAQTFVRRTFASGADRSLLLEYAERAGIAEVPSAHLSIGAAEGEPVTFVLSRASFAALRAHGWPGNVRELELLMRNATLFALADALGAVERGRAPGAPGTIPIPTKLVREILLASWVAPDEPSEPAPEPTPADSTTGPVSPSGSLRDVARALERNLYERLFRETSGDFVAMAGRLLEGVPEANARRVRSRAAVSGGAEISATAVDESHPGSARRGRPAPGRCAPGGPRRGGLPPHSPSNRRARAWSSASSRSAPARLAVPGYVPGLRH